jgi:signal recognition particle subunit SRP68
MTLCHELAQESSGDENDPEKLERKDLFATRAEIVLRPLFRYCQYELKEAGDEAVEEPVLSASTSALTPSPQDSVVFRGQELAIDNKDLRVLLLKLQSLKGTQEINFIQSLSTLDDALAIIQSSFAALEGSKAGPAVNAKKQRLDLWKGYLTYEKTMRVMGHTSKLLETIEGHAERVHVYDALLQHNRTLLQLPRPEDSDEDEFSLQAQANSLRLRALKCYHMAMHYFLQRKQYAHSVALVQQSQTLAKRALEEIAACDDDMPHHTEYMEELEQLESKLEGAPAGVQAALFLSTCSSHVQKTNRPLLLRLDEADAGTVLADVPPAIMPMPCKPIFYDLAYDVAVDSTESTDAIQKYIEDHTVQPKSSSVGGLLGWFSGK